MAFVVAFPVNRYPIARVRDTRWSTSTTTAVILEAAPDLWVAALLTGLEPF